MSFNIHLSYKQRDIESFQTLCLNRAQAGFTGTARIEIGHALQFGEVLINVVDIVHVHQVPHGDKAPVSTILCNTSYPSILSDEDVKVLKEHGFK